MAPNAKSWACPTRDMPRNQPPISQGGHNIPDDVIRRRFAAGLNQFEKTYKPIVNAWFLYNNQHRPPILLSEGVNP